MIDASMVDARGIMFSAPMVQAFLAGRKTMTRRPADIDIPQDDAEIVMRGDAGCSVHIPGVGYGPIVECPYGGPGDWLYVKEALQLHDRRAGADDVAVYAADDAVCPYLDRWRWQTVKLSPMFMPRDCRRLELRIGRVGIERLQDISRKDAIAEGAFFTDYGKHDHVLAYANRPTETWIHQTQRAGWSMTMTTSHEQCLGSPEMAFAAFYNVIHGGERWNTSSKPAPWDLNPFVWVVAFDDVRERRP